MEIITLKKNKLELPESIARKLRGKNMAIEEVDQGILLKFTVDPIQKARGMLKGKGFTTQKYLSQKTDEIISES